MSIRILLACCLAFAAAPTYGQDIITRSDGVKLQASILDMKPGLIRFKLFGQPDTAVYQISTQDVETVHMADGTTKNFTAPADAGKKNRPFNYYTNSGRNILWYYPLDLIYANFTLAYERILPSGKTGIKIPLSIGLSPGNADVYSTSFRDHNRYGAGLEINFYPFGQGRLQYYLGPAFNFRSYKAFYATTSQFIPEAHNATMYSLALKNGIHFQASRSFILSLDAGLGVRFIRQPEIAVNYNDYEGRTRAYLPGNLHLGYRF
jgi:hypothetical protein